MGTVRMLRIIYRTQVFEPSYEMLKIMKSNIIKILLLSMGNSWNNTKTTKPCNDFQSSVHINIHVHNIQFKMCMQEVYRQRYILSLRGTCVIPFTHVHILLFNPLLDHSFCSFESLFSVDLWLMFKNHVTDSGYER